MLPKTFSISEEAYNELLKLKEGDESFTQLILRLTSARGTPETILKIVRDIHEKDPNGSLDLANNIEKVYLDR